MYKQVKNPDGTISTTIVFNSDKGYIPLDEANTDYQEYLKWLSEGNTPEEAE